MQLDQLMKSQDPSSPADGNIGLVMHNFAILKPVVAPPRLQNLSILPPVRDPAAELAFIWEGRLSPTDPMAFDIETKGNDPSDPSSIVVGVGLADSRGSCYIDLRDSWPGTWIYLLCKLDEHRIPLIAHNLFFDASYVLRDMKASGHPTGWLNWQHCTYALYKLLASEGWAGQRWGLKDAQQQLLGWTETNEGELDRWLVDNGHGTRITNAEGIEVLRPRKEMMHLAPSHILGHYCALDADSTYLLYTQVLQPALERFTALQRYAAPEIYGAYIRLLIEGRLGGILIDRPKLEDYAAQLRRDIDNAKRSFLEHATVAPAIAEYNRRIISEHYLAEPAKFLKLKQRPPEPPKLTKSGKISKNYTKWLENGPKYEVPVISKNWRKWWDRLLQAMDEQHFNLDSGPQKQWLFYQWLQYPVELKTESDQPAVDERALKQFGEPGQLLISYNEKQKELSYVEACLEHLRPDGTSSAVPARDCGAAGRVHALAAGDNNAAVPPSWFLHAGFRVPGTLTGRLAGAGGLNIQQVPKTRGYLECWIARPGKVLLEFDFESLEQVVLAELSRDASLWKLYGPGAPKQDVYLYNGAFLPGLGSKIRAAGYNPDAPTAAGIAAAKEACKKERAVAKIVTLGSSYGMGANKLRRTLKLEGIEVSIEEAQRIHDGYWQLYQGVKEYEAELLRQMDLNGGWVLNAIGRPVGVAAGYEKDIVNRCVQAGGHDLLILFLTLFVVPELRKAKISFHPWILDWHDEFIIEINEIDTEAARHIVDNVALPAFNELMGGQIPLKGNATISTNLADAKGLPK